MHSLSGRRHLHRSVGVVCAAVLLAACSSSAEKGQNDEKSEPEVSATPTMLGTVGLQLPLDAYDATREETDALQQGQGVLISRCMERFGFRYSLPPRPVSATTGGANARIFGVVDASEAARYGYNVPGDARAPERTPESLTASEELALHGAPDLTPTDMPKSQAEAEKEGGGKQRINGRSVPVGGCGREAFLKLYAPEPNAVDALYVFNLKSQAESRAREDSRTKTVNKYWSDCMARKGHTVSDPMNATTELGIPDDALASPAAITAAKADVRCKKEVNLVGVYFAVQSAYQKRQIDKNSETLDLAKKQLKNRLKLTASLISSP
ncbi:hypothetical protein [Streptomyces brevispora]|uniref:PknH-like protein n=1 Tax=Streptomyces brevispora TaxID=887462 RepID=A0A561V047_9ACTN|nr:hypothetical protein [Streptomyces brevispora]TWG04974.1 hypothetical protein FHX80_113446 [Streptomyces brevispora]WSC13975.1 hypothetical protein OIE64_14715 [Streptomyces brevispora]